MNSRKASFGLVLLIVSGLAGCKLVKIADKKASSSSGTMFADNTARLDSQAAAMWQPKVLPYMREKAVDLPALRSALSAGFDAGAKKLGYRAAANGAPWNFAVRFAGKIVEADTKSRAATISIDTNGDGKADATVALGPVILSTSLRDVLPFVRFGDYKNQIAFAGISKALNAYAYDHVLKEFPRQSIVGKQVEGIGATSLSSAGGMIKIVPVELEEKSQ
jgi:predicted lipoprotein